MVIFHSYVSLLEGSDWLNEVDVFEIDSLITFLWKVKTLMAEENSSCGKSTSNNVNLGEPWWSPQNAMLCQTKMNPSTFIIYPLVI